MALRLYHDDQAANEITALNPDTIEEAVPVGEDLDDQKQIYLASDDSNLTYENISITKASDSLPPTVVLEYAADDNGSPSLPWQTTLTPPNGNYITPVPIWRRVFKADVQEAFTRDDINHEVTADEFVQ